MGRLLDEAKQPKDYPVLNEKVTPKAIAPTKFDVYDNTWADLWAHFKKVLFK